MTSSRMALLLLGLTAVLVAAGLAVREVPRTRPAAPAVQRHTAAHGPVVRPPRLVTGAAESAPPSTVEPDSPAQVYSGFQVKWPDREPPAPAPVLAPPIAETDVDSLGRYAQEVCACDSLACAERVGMSHLSAVAASRYRPEDEPALDRIRKRVSECLAALSPGPVPAEPSAAGG